MCLSTHSFVQFCKVNTYPYTPGPLLYHHHLNAPSCWFLYPGDNPSCLYVLILLWLLVVKGWVHDGAWSVQRILLHKWIWFVGSTFMTDTASCCWVLTMVCCCFSISPCHAMMIALSSVNSGLGVLPQNCLKCWQKFYRKPSCLWALYDCMFLITQTNQ